MATPKKPTFILINFDNYIFHNEVEMFYGLCFAETPELGKLQNLMLIVDLVIGLSFINILLMFILNWRQKFTSSTVKVVFGIGFWINDTKPSEIYYRSKTKITEIKNCIEMNEMQAKKYGYSIFSVIVTMSKKESNKVPARVLGSISNLNKRIITTKSYYLGQKDRKDLAKESDQSDTEEENYLRIADIHEIDLTVAMDWLPQFQYSRSSKGTLDKVCLSFEEQLIHQFKEIIIEPKPKKMKN
jgi:hypothetical protein